MHMHKSSDWKFSLLKKTDIQQALAGWGRTHDFTRLLLAPVAMHFFALWTLYLVQSLARP